MPCPKCGKPEAVPSAWCACPDCIAKYDAEMAALQDRARVEAVERLWRQSGLAGPWRSKTFESFDVRLQPAAFNACRRYAETFLDNQGESLALIGEDYGIGKTHLAVSVGNYVLSNFMRSVVFTTGQELMLRLRATFSNRDATEYELLSAIRDADLVILDDVGKEKYSEYVESIYYHVINSRYVASKPILLTSNLAWADLGERIGYAAMSRLSEMCRVVEMRGNDYRLKRR